MKTHLEDCAECREYLEVIRKGLSIINEEKNPEVNPFFYSSLKAKMENRAEQKIPVRARRILQPVLFSLVLLVGIGFGIMMGAKMGKAPAQQESYQMYSFNELSSEPIENYFLD